ncbi:FAD-dependent oxidoreductase [Sediminibacterium ginsengisoli]|uniref:Rieske domain-containing protein n=1 Tax=Sediminibacterium ginsengisoli TaxID=413434 RepID=A0A1T4P8K0_9BACT|nr:FAD-dependent oxidoreductase [Sediminibacterium ginsengisoli]SJZ87814.1 hypothetical protein SAMN04488132_105211 [Sediminibacterium ginsengisoli]
MTPRDGACVSLWQDSVTPFRPVNQPDRNLIYDVAIAGGGITGLTTALLLQQSGKSCILLEAETLGFGTSGGTTAHINTFLDTPYSTIHKNFGEDNAQLVANAAKEAIELISRNIRDHHIECGFEYKPAYVFAETEEEEKELRKIHEATIGAGVDMEAVTEIPVPFGFKSAFRINGQAQFHPLDYLLALAKAFEDAGGIIIQHCRVLDVQNDTPLDIETDAGNYKAVAIVFATHIPVGINLLHLRCIPYRSYAMAVTLENDAAYPEALVYDSQDPYHYYRTQLVDGKKYMIAGGYDHRTAEEENTENRFRQLEAYLRTHFAVEEVHYRWSSQYFEPADGLPYIGHLPGHPGNIYVATGFGGNGMTYSAVAALLLKSMILGETSPYQSLFNPNRIKPVAGFLNFIKHNADVAVHLAGSLWSATRIATLSELAPGEGKVVKYDDHKIALYKDEAGVLHAVHAACTHMKCSVTWNTAERSWDCPCHGARFSAAGKVLTGPANIPLEPIQLNP